MPRGLLGFRAEYAKSHHSTCRGCGEKIDKETLRLAKVFQARSFGGQLPIWYHYDCFWEHAYTKRLTAFKGLDMLRWKDQQKIKDKVAGQPGDRLVSSLTDNDFEADFASSSASKCKECNGRIYKHTVRLSRKSRTGQKDYWYHVDCFIIRRWDIGFGNDKEPQRMQGFDKLKKEDQDMLQKKFKEIKPKFSKNYIVSDSSDESSDESNEPPTKKKKKIDSKEDEILKEQSQLLWTHRDNLNKHTTKAERRELLEHNLQAVPSGDIALLDQLSDVMTFGSLMPCEQCRGQLVYSGNYVGYLCKGHVSGWTKCNISTKSPKRIPFVVPDTLKHVTFLDEYQYVQRDRHFPVIKKSKLKKADSDSSSVSSSDGLVPQKGVLDPNRPQPLRGMRFVIIGKMSKPKHDVKKSIILLGGKVVPKVDKKVAACISNTVEVKKNTPKIQEAQSADVHVVDEGFLESVKKGGAVLLIQAHSIASWGCDPLDRIDDKVFSTPKQVNPASRQSGGKAGNDNTLVWKDGLQVDAQTGLESEAHVLQENGVAYNVVLGMVDIACGINAFYKMQLLEANDKTKFWVFRTWGHLGRADIGGKRMKDFKAAEKYDALKKFKRLYREKTGNPWDRSGDFVKKPNKFYPLDIDYGADNTIKLADAKNTTLEQPIQDLVKMLFDVESMKQTMVELEIDLNKMPLGKLSGKQLEEGYCVLNKLQKLIDKGDSKQIELLDASNQFYTLIPHDFKNQRPPLLDTETIIKAKREMLDNLMEIEIAYNLMKDANGGKDPIQEHYEKLKTGMQVLDKSSEEFLLLGKYVQNTQRKGTFAGYDGQIIDAFKIERQGEESRYKTFENLHNRKLLWHGSRTTNFAGILSQGLRIAPPEAPMSGYMFGKGLYFADMLAKSANYCRVSSSSPVGLLLLCEVALGDMYENQTFTKVEKLPDGKHSLKGIGRHNPDPAESHFTPDGVEIPLGKQVNGNGSSLEYNEYVVYDVAQVRMKYLLKMKLK